MSTPKQLWFAACYTWPHQINPNLGIKRTRRVKRKIAVEPALFPMKPDIRFMQMMRRVG